MRIALRTATLAGVLALGLANAAGAAPAARPDDDLSRVVFGPPRLAEAQASRIPGIAKTSVDYRLAKEGAVGSLGFLCGLKASSDRGGAAQAYGSDANGRFVGAKVRVAF
jgi:hypothetical protein